jgi:hypothetical protein
MTERDLDCEERWCDLDAVRLRDVDLDGVRRVDEDRWRDLDRLGVRLLDIDLDVVRRVEEAGGVISIWMDSGDSISISKTKTGGVISIWMDAGDSISKTKNGGVSSIWMDPGGRPCRRSTCVDGDEDVDEAAS